MFRRSGRVAFLAAAFALHAAASAGAREMVAFDAGFRPGTIL
jgi:hypothetical protein